MFSAANKVQAIELDAIQALLRCLQTYSGCGRECELHITCVSALLNLFDEEDSSGEHTIKKGERKEERYDVEKSWNEKERMKAKRWVREKNWRKKR